MDRRDDGGRERREENKEEERVKREESADVGILRNFGEKWLSKRSLRL